MHWFQLSEGLAEYRLGQFSRAVESMQRIQKNFDAGAARYDGARDICEANSYLILAMALQQLEKPAAARTALSQGSTIVHTKLPPLDGGDLGEAWWDTAIAYILMREASGLIEGPPADGKEKGNR